MTDFVKEPERQTPVMRKVDVVVIGGGPGGFGAAVAAARNGAETLLIERYGFLGGMLTGGMVRWLPIDKLIPFESYGETRPLQGGIVQELVARLVDEGGAIDPSAAYHSYPYLPASIYTVTDHEISKVVLADMLEESKAEILLHSFSVDVVKEGNEIKGVIIESKSGRQAILADSVIDASGDADIAAAAGAEYDKAGERLPFSFSFFMANVDIEKAKEYGRHDRESIERLNSLVTKAIKDGNLHISGVTKVLPELPTIRIFSMVCDDSACPPNWYRRGEAGAWAESLKGDATNVHDLTRAELTAQRTSLERARFFRRYVPGYENSYLAYTNTTMGLRESRRVLGGYFLTADGDMRQGLKHNDVIVKSRTSGLGLPTYTPERAPVFDIPYRCIVPKVIDGLLVAGRCISVDHKAAMLLSPRDECTCMCLGEAAGTAAALSIKKKVRPRDLDINVLQEALKKQGANLG